MHKKHIVVISPAKFPGRAGDTANYSEIINQLIIEGFQVSLICPKNDDYDKESLEISDHVNIIRIPCKPPRLKQIKNGFKLQHYLRILLFLIVEFFTVSWVLARKRIRYVFVRHGLLTMQLPIIFRLLKIRVMADGELISDMFNGQINSRILSLVKSYEKNIVKLYTYFKVPTYSQAENLQKFGLPKDRILIIPICINIKKIPRFTLEEIPEHTFGYFGALELWSGVDVLLEGFELLLKKIPSATLFIIGEGSLKDSLKETVICKNLGSNVIFASLSREELWNEYFRKFRIVVNPMLKQTNSMDSNLPIKLIESLAAGKPIVVMDIPSMKELPKESVFIVESASPQALAKAMETLSLDKDRMKRYATVALASSNNYDIGDKIKNLVSALVESC